MFPSFLHRLLLRRHFWRYATFDEVAELYASRTMRLIAQYMIALFVALYLYEHGFSVLFIACYFVAVFALRMPMAVVAAYYVARFGPKHGILLGNLLYIPALVFFALVPEYGIYAVVGFGFFQALSMVTYDLSYLVDFSKVKHVEHAGKEIGFMQIFERIAASLSPLIGGVVAFCFGAEATMWLAAALFAAASWPLLRTAEQTQTRQKLEFQGFPWRSTWRSMRAETAVGFDTVASNAVWVLFLAVAVFAGSSNDIYLKVGAFASITVVTSFVTAYVYGRLIDRRRGGDLLRIATVANALTHLFRPFVATPASVAVANITNEMATTGYSMAFTRGLFDTADNSGRRIVYLLFIEIALNLGATLACVVFAVLVLLLPTPTLAMQVFFVITAFYVLLLASGRFALYRSR
jgi:MFS family permease